MTTLDKIILDDGTYGEIVDIDIDGSSAYFTMHQYVITVADGTGFTLGGYISADGENDNDGVGIIRQMLSDIEFVVDVQSGTFVDGGYVDHNLVYSADTKTTIESIAQNLIIHRYTYDNDAVFGTYI